MKPFRDRIMALGSDLRVSRLALHLLVSTYRSVEEYRRGRDMPRAMREEKLLKALLEFLEKKHPR